MTSSAQIMEEVTLKALNQLTSGHSMLMLLRVLNTSDLTFTYMLLNKNTIEDILKMVKGILDLEAEQNVDYLSKEEKDEILGYIRDMEHNPTSFSSGTIN